MDVGKKLSFEYWYLFLILGGYTVASSFAIPLGIENTRLFSVPFRVLIFLFSLFIIYRNITFEKFKNIGVITLVFFWLFYTVKVFYSFGNHYYTPEFLQNSREVYVRIFLIILFPSLALSVIDYRRIDLYNLAKQFFYLLVIMLSINFVYGMIMPHEAFRFKFIFSMYYISYGHIGTSLAIISLFFILFRERVVVPKFWLYYGFILGILTIVVGAARSPILAMIVVFFYLLIAKGKLKFILYYFLGILLFIFGIYIYKILGFKSIDLADRIYNWIFEGDTSLRMPLFERGIDMFKNRPLLGDRILYEDGGYPHNVFLELLMATGIIGFLLYFSKFIPVFKNYSLFFTGKAPDIYILFFAFFLQYLVLVLTSFSLYSVPEFLYFSSIIIGIGINHRYEKT